MDKQPSRRYNIWSLAQPVQALPVSGQKEREKDPAPQITKLDDLQTSLLLYGYGLPIDVALGGVCRLPDGQSTKCKTKRISSESVDLVYDAAPFGSPNNPNDKTHMGSAVQLSLAGVGVVGGIITSQDLDGFRVAVDGNCQSALSAKLADIAAARGIRHEVKIAAGPSVIRVEPKHKNCAFDDQRGILRKGTIVNVSQIDALIKTSIIPPKPTVIIFRGTRRYAAEVTSTFAIGFMAEFCSPIPTCEFSDDIKFSDA
ncbi:hypothetical protein [Methyloferula stellata]|uniref:hypothetical protein n=1 Tax=Methyloferula stellata TaxID=876270 RepID=UPI00035D6A60|nr:hypothetical protein [Methyloferula stellata]